MVKKMKIIERPIYLERLKYLKDKPEIKVITGLRRSGKSKLLEAFERYLLLLGVEPDHLIVIDLDLQKNAKYKDKDVLGQYVSSHLLDRKKYYVFLDEVQECAGFEMTVRSLASDERVDIYLTGSNSRLLSGELATLLGGRTKEVKVFPFSFKEYIDYFSLQNNVSEALESYKIYGGMPGSLHYSDNPNERSDYLRSVYNTVANKDIAARYHIEDTDALERTMDFVCDNIANFTSAKKISDSLNEGKRSIGYLTVVDYLQHLQESLLISKAKRYDIKGKEYLKSLEKYYLADIGFRFAMLGKKGADEGRIIENIVYIELLRRGYDVWVGKLGEKEIDFRAVKNGTIFYFQVTDILSKATSAREFAPLYDLKDNYSRTIIAGDRLGSSETDGIHIVGLANWLLGE